MKKLVGLYRLLLIVLPSRFRNDYGKEMTLAFADLLRDAGSARGGWGILVVGLSCFRDLLATGIRERWAGVGIGGMAAWTVATLSAGFLVYLDWHQADAQGPLLVLLGATFILAALDLPRAWQWVLVVGLPVPASDLARAALGLIPLTPSLFGEFAILIPAAIGAGIGSVARILASLSRSPDQEVSVGGFSILCASCLFGGFVIGLADFTLITPIHSIVGIVLCGFVIGGFSYRPAIPAFILGFGVPVAITLMMAAHLRPIRPHFVFIDARAIPLCVTVALAASAVRRRAAPPSGRQVPA